jgi:dipeptidyl aminopeptidase/acylaminoacyl peptidase
MRRLAFVYMGVRKIRKFSVLAVAVMACGLLASCGTAPVASETSALSAPEHATLQSIVDLELDSTTLELGEQVEKNEAFTTTAVTYDSGKETVTGALSVPTSDGPHPAIVLIHGVVDPDVYEPGSGLVREQVHFAKAGYIVLSTDLRNSTATPDSAEALGVDLGSTLDAINAVRALRASGLPTLDDGRIAILGHSLGGLLTLNTIVTKPELVDAAVVVAPASITPSKNIDYLTTMFAATPDKIIDEYGTPSTNPEFWSAISPRNLIDRVEVPLLIEHGTADTIIPYAWSEETATVWRHAGKQVELVPLKGEDHVLQARWNEAMTVAEQFLQRELSPAD